MALKSLNTDIVFICDTRLVSNKGVKGTQRLKNKLRDARGRSYVVFANSNSNSRGVAILTAAELNINTISIHIDPEENFIFIHTQYMGQDLLLGAIYGPNNNLLTSLRDCTNLHTLSTNLFDHKSVSLFLGSVKSKNSNKQKYKKLRNTGLTDPILLHKVLIAAYKSHLYSLDTGYICEILGSTATLTDNMLNSLKLIENLLAEYIALCTLECEGGGGGFELSFHADFRQKF